ncbi:TetR/AcrR family transcriptional regulator [Rhodococcus sp. HNM0569]|uniref:TetR/AcrR family transcriptional regulator n=1 Tax=Rhodococcus sp. HNM0569 TaxID=2716340 RepID=UPI00146C76E9|nr:TetR/AcrR family transcriptional regulator [Rhodococcus sp. HNM0569]NLU82948.1 TetR/AcrR family transcriptional regulator [Rhodococcus sp. HNM0569]
MSDAAGREVKRRYSSPLRQEAAARTRALVARAAADLFVEHGYVGTTVGQIAERAGVAVRTVHSAFRGGKPELFDHAVSAALDAEPDATLAADGAVSPDAVDTTTAIVDRLVGYSVEVLERTGALVLAAISSSGADEHMRAFAADTLRDTRSNAATLAEGLAASDLLRRDISVQYAADVLFVVVSPQVHDLLRRQCGWTVEEYRRLVTDTVRRGLLRTDAG